MKVLTYRQDGKEKLGVVCQQHEYVYPLESLGLKYKSMNELIEKLTQEEKELITEATKKDCKDKLLLQAVEKMAPIPCPKQDIICLGINYMAHAEESARYKEEAFGGDRPFAVYFSKRVNEAVGDGGFIEGHFDSVDSLDYEVELAVIIGKDAKNVAKEEAFNYIFGYTIINDVSARNLQTRHKQWYFGKSLDGFTPMGPWIVTTDELKHPNQLKITSKVNGKLRQNSKTDLLIFKIDHVISELSHGMTLKAGTIIAMGTPAGVGMGFVPPKFLKPGDEVVCEIEGIGCLKNIVG